jgi:hypothetical protein
MKRHDDPFEFEFWRDLAASDPAAFEAARARVLASLIEAAPRPARPRLAGLQWQIDRLRDRAPSPFAACSRISGMMWDAVLGESGLLDHIARLGDAPATDSPPGATVVPFARPPARD